MGRNLSTLLLTLTLLLLTRSTSYFSSGSPGSSGCLGPGRRSPGRQSWCKRRWRRWSRRRYPPSRCWPTFWTLMTTSGVAGQLAVTPTIPAMSSPRCPMAAPWWGEWCWVVPLSLTANISYIPPSSPSSVKSETEAVPHHPLHRELCLILKEIKVITDKIRDDEESGAVESDWKFAAMVLDRLCLVTYTTFTIVATVAMLSTAPHVFV